MRMWNRGEKRWRPASVGVVLAAAAVWMGWSPTVQAVITRLTPLAEVLETERFIFVAQAVRIEADKPAVVFAVVRTLKGEPPFERLAVNMTGDEEAKKFNDSKTIMERLDTRRAVIFFVNKRNKRYQAMAFVEGTWFSLQGFEEDSGRTVRWAFLHGEPFLRRTFAGTSAELIRVIEDGLAGRAAPPPPNEKMKPGYGPPAQTKPADGNKNSLAPLAPRWVAGQGLWAVIPSFVLVGPLAVLAAIFPGVFARLAATWKRWRAFLTIASINSTLALLHFFLQNWWPQGWWWGTQALTVYLLVISLVGLIWAGLRYRRYAAAEPAATAIPSRSEILGLLIFTALAAVCVLGTIWWTDLRSALTPPLREFTCLSVAVAAALLYACYRRLTAPYDLDGPNAPAPERRLSLSGEFVALTTVAVCLGIALAWQSSLRPTLAPVSVDSDLSADVIGPRLIKTDVLEAFEVQGGQRLPLRGQVLSRVVVHGNRLYFGIVEAGLSSVGRIVCLDANSGQVVWSYDGDDRPLLPVYCTPLLVDNVLYCGEGLHEHSGCRLVALDAHTGQPRWSQPFRTNSHTEGTPGIVHDLLIVPAGDDGVYALTRSQGQLRWHLPGGRSNGLHVDGAPAIHDGCIYIGSGLYSYQAICLDAATGQELWRAELPFRSFAAPTVWGDHVYYGVGTGNLSADIHTYPEEKLDQPEKEAAGAVVCLQASTGKLLWRTELPRGVHTGLAVDAFSVYAACRDGAIYALDRRTGRQRWRVSIGGAITSQPAVATLAGVPVAVYAVSREGLIVCLHPQTGQLIWNQPLPKYQWDGLETSGVLGGPTLVTELLPNGHRRTIYIGAMTVDPNNLNRRTVAVFRFVDEITEP
jgi:outer membrane protein assembly factor BamB